MSEYFQQIIWFTTKSTFFLQGLLKLFGLELLSLQQLVTLFFNPFQLHLVETDFLLQFLVLSPEKLQLLWLDLLQRGWCREGRLFAVLGVRIVRADWRIVAGIAVVSLVWIQSVRRVKFLKRNLQLCLQLAVLILNLRHLLWVVDLLLD